MLELLKAIFFGIVEGITEWLPISSTGHLILLNEFISLDVSEQFFSMFEVVIQLGAILAVVLLFWNEIWPFSTKEKNYIRQDTFIMWFKIVVACIPAAVVEILFGDVIEELFYNYIVIAFALILFGISRNKPFRRDHTWRNSAWGIACDCSGIYIFFGDSGDVWRKPDESTKVWICIYLF